MKYFQVLTFLQLYSITEFNRPISKAKELEKEEEEKNC